MEYWNELRNDYQDHALFMNLIFIMTYMAGTTTSLTFRYHKTEAEKLINLSKATQTSVGTSI